jgi:hypothetical protein
MTAILEIAQLCHSLFVSWTVGEPPPQLRIFPLQFPDPLRSGDPYGVEPAWVFDDVAEQEQVNTSVASSGPPLQGRAVLREIHLREAAARGNAPGTRSRVKSRMPHRGALAVVAPKRSESVSF